MKRCTRCVLPETYPGITFDEAGVCNYCRSHQPWQYLGQDALQRLIEPLRGRGNEYDCVAGVSGGRDSSYMLYYLVKVCNLRVLAWSADNGFVPEAAKANLRHMASALGVDLIIQEHDILKRHVHTNVSAWLRHPSPVMIPMICCGCRLGVSRGLLEHAKLVGAPLVAMSLSTPLERGYLKQALFAAHPLGGHIGSHLLSQVSTLAYETLRSPAYLKPDNAGICAAEYAYFFHLERIQRLLYPGQRLLDFYRYIEWDEERILSTITQQLGWRQDARSASSWRFDCRLSYLKNHLMEHTIGSTEKEDGLSNMIREGMITRDQALERLESETVIPPDLIRELLGDIGLGEAHASLVTG